jgi:hypothetical protein
MSERTLRLGSAAVAVLGIAGTVVSSGIWIVWN